MPRGKPEAPLIDRFLRRVNKQGKKVSEELGHCWEWQGAKYVTGYGQLLQSTWGVLSTHRWSYKYYSGNDIPEGYEICHRCDNRCCVNPDHLTCEPKQENIRQMNERNPKAFNRKFTKEDVANIKLLRAEGLFYKEIAQRYGVNRRTIERLCLDKTYIN